MQPAGDAAAAPAKDVGGRRARLVIDATALLPKGKGVAVYARNLLRTMHATERAREGLGPRSMEVTVLVTPPAVELVRAACARWRIVPVEVPSQLLWRLVGLPRTAHALRADLVHILNEGPVGPMPAPFALAVHELPHLYARRVPGGRASMPARLLRPLTQRAVLSACRRAAVVLPVSRATADDVIREAGVPGERVRVAPDGVASEFFEAARATPASALARVAERYVLLFATGDRREMIVEAVEAFAAVARDLSIALVVAGRCPDALRASIDERLAALGAGRSAIYLGFVEDTAMPALYRGAAVLLELSRYEGFGLQAAEAMAAGTPVIATAIPALLEVVGDAGLTVDPRAAAPETAAALRRLLTDDRLHSDLGRRSEERARAYSWEVCAAETWRAIGALCAGLEFQRLRGADG